MCVAFAVAGDGWRLAATDLGVNCYDGDELVERKTTPRRLGWAGGWMVGSGDARAVLGTLETVEDANDTGQVQEKLQEAAQAAETAAHEPGELYGSTRVLAATEDGVRRWSTTGESAGALRAPGFWLLTPPDLEQAAEFSTVFGNLFDASNLVQSVAAAQIACEHVAEHSEVTADVFMCGILKKEGNRWIRLQETFS